MDAGALVDGANEYGQTPVYLAVLYGHEAATELLCRSVKGAGRSGECPEGGIPHYLPSCAVGLYMPSSSNHLCSYVHLLRPSIYVH